MRTVLDKLNSAMMVLMYLIILIQIVAREALHVATAWSTEIGVILFTLIVLFGTPGAARSRSHLKVDALYSHFPELVKTLLEVVFSLVYIAFFVVMAAGAYRNATEYWTVGIPTLEWFRVGWIYLLIAIAAVLIILSYAVNLVEDIRSVGKRLCSRS